MTYKGTMVSEALMTVQRDSVAFMVVKEKSIISSKKNYYFAPMKSSSLIEICCFLLRSELCFDQEDLKLGIQLISASRHLPPPA